MTQKWSVPPELAPYAEFTHWPLVEQTENLMNGSSELADDPVGAVAKLLIAAQWEILGALHASHLLATPYTAEEHADIREAIRRTLAHAENVNYDELEDHDYQRQADLLLAMLITRENIPPRGRSLRVFKMRNHNLPVEQDPVDMQVIDGLSDDQFELLRRVTDDSVWYDSDEVTEGSS